MSEVDGRVEVMAKAVEESTVLTGAEGHHLRGQLVIGLVALDAYEREHRPAADELRAAIGKAIHGYACGCERHWPISPDYEEMVSAVLDAIGPVRQESPSDRDLLRALAASCYGVVDNPRDLLDAGLLMVGDDEHTGEVGTILTNNARDLIRAAINREEA